MNRRFGKWILAALLVSGLAYSEKRPPRIPVMITVRKIDHDRVYFQPMIAPTFEGILVGKAKDKISKCYATSEHVADLKDGGEVASIVIDCGDAKIQVTTVDFE